MILVGKALTMAILAVCPGWDMDNGQVITTACQEFIVNCSLNKAGRTGADGPTQSQIDSCRDERAERLRRGGKDIPSTLVK